MARRKQAKPRSIDSAAPITSPAPSRWRIELVWLALAIGLTYASAVPGGFVWLDHAEIEQANYRVADTDDWNRVWWQTIEQYQGKRSGVTVEKGGYWRPIYALGISLDWALWNDRPWINHVENIIWHFAVVVGLYFLGNQVFGSAPWGRQAVFWATLLFAVHPFGVHSVTWISGRKDTMCAAFGVASLLALGRVVGEARAADFGRVRIVAWLAIASVCLLLAIGSKELGFVVPMVATVFFWPPIAAGNDAEQRRLRNLRLAGLATLWALAVAMLIYRIAIVQATGLDAPYPTESLARNAAMSANVWWHYVVRILIPYQVQLSDAWPRVLQLSLPDVLSIVAWLAAAVAVVVGLIRRHPIALAVAWFVIWALPASGIVPLRHFRAERYLYPASWGILLAAILLLLPWLAQLFASQAQRAIAITFTVIAVCFALVTARENTYWWGDNQLFQHSVAIDPHHVEAQIELSRLALEREDYAQTVELARGAIEQLRDPAYMEYGVPYFAHTWLGTGLVRVQQPAAARTEFNTALQQFPNSPAGHANLAMAEVALGNLPQAKLHFERSLELNPGDSGVRHNLSLALLQAGDFAAAENQLAQLARDEPSDAAHRARLAWSQWKQGRREAANANLYQARRQSPQDPIVQRVDEMIRQDQTSSANEPQ